MAEKHRALIYLLAGLFTIGLSNAAHSVECFPGPDFQPPPGARWQYLTDPATKQGCWFVEEMGSARRRTKEVARSSRSVPSTSERTAAQGAPRNQRQEVVSAGAPSLNLWFTSELPGLTGPFRAYSPTETDQDATKSQPVTPKRRQTKATVSRTTERSRPEQQSETAQRKPGREHGESAGTRHRYSISAVALLEAAGDKPVPGLPTLVGHDLRKAMEAVGDKDVVGATADLRKDWERALYEEFLRWRLNQAMPQ